MDLALWHGILLGTGAILPFMDDGHKLPIMRSFYTHKEEEPG
jgi:hypothetical protein